MRAQARQSREPRKTISLAWASMGVSMASEAVRALRFPLRPTDRNSTCVRVCVRACDGAHPPLPCRDKIANEIKSLHLEKENLTVELALTREKSRKYKEEVQALTDSLNNIKVAKQTSISDAADILEHKQQEIMKKEDRIIDLETRLQKMADEVRNANECIRRIPAARACQALHREGALATAPAPFLSLAHTLIDTH